MIFQKNRKKIYCFKNMIIFCNGLDVDSSLRSE